MIQRLREQMTGALDAEQELANTRNGKVDGMIQTTFNESSQSDDLNDEGSLIATNYEEMYNSNISMTNDQIKKQREVIRVDLLLHRKK